MDSLADVVTFGVAPAVLAVSWGVQFVDGTTSAFVADHLRQMGYFIAFLFLLCGAVRLARFNVQKNPVPKNPGKPDRKYFVGLPIPAAAALVAAIVFAADSAPIEYWPLSLAWLALMALLAFLMVSTWRYRSMKDVQLLAPRSPLTVIVWGGFFYLIWNFPEPVLLAMAVTYVGSGIVVRLGGIVKRRLRHPVPRTESLPG
jgi:CDP-diacylglycerol--serine O-phosphatidyltransferase